ncbi:MAG: hypothetical protein QNJ45_00155 [Ardenticatenaceae bacterium]|nr:hypothetical protein [Ardenticatenaceae bacterium]
MTILQQNIRELNKKTADTLREIATDPDIRRLSKLSLPQIDGVIDDIVRLLPGNDLPTFILRGLTKLPGRQVTLGRMQKDTVSLLEAWEHIKQIAVFGTVFAGPAAVILLYQRLLQLAGKTAEQAFPDGYWQFYVDFALREDSARHTHETGGFDQLLSKHEIHLDQVDRVTAWVMAAIEILFDYPMILRNEWRERIYLRELRQLVSPGHKLYERVQFASKSWSKNRPYRRGPDVRPGESYPFYRQRKFDDFIAVYLAQLTYAERMAWVEVIQKLKEEDLPAFQDQMSILAYLEAGPYGDQRIPLKLTDTHIGIIYNGHYYLIPAVRPNTAEPPDVTVVRSQVFAIINELSQSSPPSSTLKPVARCPRAYLKGMLKEVDRDTFEQLNQLKRIPILINIDNHPSSSPLARIRQAERGIGSHPVTVFDAANSFVFDLSHIFFDGTWGAAFSEMMTNTATAWAVYLHTLPQIHPQVSQPQVLHFDFSSREKDLFAQIPAVVQETNAETEGVHLRNLLALRRLFKLRNDLIRLTVNDILVLYRGIHALTYQPAANLVEKLHALSHEPAAREAALLTLAEIQAEYPENPTMLIPVDASEENPRDRIYPLCFQVPVRELRLISLHQEVIEALDAYKNSTSDRGELYQRFDDLQRQYLGILAGLGVVFITAKNAAARGDTVSVNTLKLLAHLPKSVQQLLDQIPNRVDMINEMIKGQEVFSNIGVVSSSSSLGRFLSAKDDNINKRMAWGILTDAHLTMRITLRDFRPHVQALYEIGEGDLAEALTVDYLETYTSGLNRYVNDLRRITMTSRETRLSSEIGLLDVHPT